MRDGFSVENLHPFEGRNPFHLIKGTRGTKMGEEEGDTASPRKERTPRANRRFNGMAAKAGLPDPPTRGRLTRTLALLDAALRVWGANHLPRRESVWRRRN